MGAYRMSQLLEIRKLPDGSVQARRKDGKPLTAEDRIEAKRLANGSVATTPNNDITEGHIIAVEICSNVLEAHIWLAFDDGFNPGDGLAVFYPDELQILAAKDAETLREIHKHKLAYGPGSRVRQ
jgi:hypothetical protein